MAWDACFHHRHDQRASADRDLHLAADDEGKLFQSQAAQAQRQSPVRRCSTG